MALSNEFLWGARAFADVATPMRDSEVIHCVHPAPHERNDMVERQGHRVEVMQRLIDDVATEVACRLITLNDRFSANPLNRRAILYARTANGADAFVPCVLVLSLPVYCVVLTVVTVYVVTVLLAPLLCGLLASILVLTTIGTSIAEPKFHPLLVQRFQFGIHAFAATRFQPSILPAVCSVFRDWLSDSALSACSCSTTDFPLSLKSKRLFAQCGLARVAARLSRAPLARRLTESPYKGLPARDALAKFERRRAIVAVSRPIACIGAILLFLLHGGACDKALPTTFAGQRDRGELFPALSMNTNWGIVGLHLGGPFAECRAGGCFRNRPASLYDPNFTTNIGSMPPFARGF